LDCRCVIGVWECRGIYMSSTTASFRVRRVHGREDKTVLTRTDGEMRYKYPPYLSLSRLLYHPHPHFQITKNRRGLGPCLFLPSFPLKVYERASHVVLPRVRIQVHTSQPTMSGSALLSISTVCHEWCSTTSQKLPKSAQRHSHVWFCCLLI
jgi:hypothetical protein